LNPASDQFLFAEDIDYPDLVALIFKNVDSFQNELLFAVLQKVRIRFTHVFSPIYLSRPAKSREGLHLTA
jgi:hypothetical protein